MKQGISPTDPDSKFRFRPGSPDFTRSKGRGARRKYRDEKQTIIHLSKALVQRCIDFTAVDEKGRVKVQYLPLHLQAPPGAAVRIVVAPDKGSTCKRAAPKLDRPGLRRRYALSGRELTVERLAERLAERQLQPGFVDFGWLQ